MIAPDPKFILAARSDARIFGCTDSQWPTGNARAGSPEILAREARKDRLQLGLIL